MSGDLHPSGERLGDVRARRFAWSFIGTVAAFIALIALVGPPPESEQERLAREQAEAGAAAEETQREAEREARASAGRAETAALTACQNLIRAAAKYPSSVSFWWTGVSITRLADGGYAIDLGFDAKNDFGAELPHHGGCLVSPSGAAKLLHFAPG